VAGQAGAAALKTGNAVLNATRVHREQTFSEIVLDQLMEVVFEAIDITMVCAFHLRALHVCGTWCGLTHSVQCEGQEVRGCCDTLGSAYVRRLAADAAFQHDA
jgi:hypothetical protein